jgi:hypothetical protein
VVPANTPYKQCAIVLDLRLLNFRFFPHIRHKILGCALFWSLSLGFMHTILDSGLCKSHHTYAQRKCYDVEIDCKLLQRCTTHSQWFACVCVCNWSKIPWVGVNF